MGQLDADWLSVEFASVEAEIQTWGEGLRASFESLVSKPSEQPAEDASKRGSEEAA
jgi:hypothetical protein